MTANGSPPSANAAARPSSTDAGAVVAPTGGRLTKVSFLDARAKTRAVSAVKAFESHTSAELVITVKKQARGYPEAHLIWGSLVAFVTLLVLLFFPVDFLVASMPVDVLLAFGVGVTLSLVLPALQRAVVSRDKRRAAAKLAAKAAFYDLGVSGTTGRTGVLVYVAVHEGTVEVVTDRGITSDAKKLADEARGPLESALARLDIEAFATTLEKLGPAFAASMPRAADDVNELPDEIH